MTLQNISEILSFVSFIVACMSLILTLDTRGRLLAMERSLAEAQGMSSVIFPEEEDGQIISPLLGLPQQTPDQLKIVNEAKEVKGADGRAFIPPPQKKPGDVGYMGLAPKLRKPLAAPLRPMPNDEELSKMIQDRHLTTGGPLTSEEIARNATMASEGHTYD
jgi:hypothetical protein